MPFVYPDNSLDFTANFLSMMWKVAEPRYEPNPVLAHALDVLFILHADHEQNCSHHRHAGRRLAPTPTPTRPPPRPPPPSTAPATAAPTRPCIRMLNEIGTHRQRRRPSSPT